MRDHESLWADDLGDGRVVLRDDRTTGFLRLEDRYAEAFVVGGIEQAERLVIEGVELFRRHAGGCLELQSCKTCYLLRYLKTLVGHGAVSDEEQVALFGYVRQWSENLTHAVIDHVHTLFGHPRIAMQQVTFGVLADTDDCFAVLQGTLLFPQVYCLRQAVTVEMVSQVMDGGDVEHTGLR